MVPLLQKTTAVANATRMPAAGTARRHAVNTDAVSVVYTGFTETLRAARIGAALATRMGVPLRVVHFRTVPRQLDVNRPAGLSPIESEEFTTRLLEEGISARARVYLCRDEAKTIPYAFKPQSIVVIGGQHSWLPTRIERWRHALEDAGHFVVLVEPSAEKEHVDA